MSERWQDRWFTGHISRLRTLVNLRHHASTLWWGWLEGFIPRLEQHLREVLELRQVHAACEATINDAKGQEAAFLDRIAKLEAELGSIDAVLARRPALDLPTRRENIEKAINVAAQADKLKRELEKEQELNAALRQERDALRMALLEIYASAKSALPESIGSIDSHRSVKFSQAELERIARLAEARR